MIRRTASITALVFSLSWAGVAFAQMQPDHLTCFKVKTDKAFKTATVDLDAIHAGYDLVGCSVKPKAKLVCVPSEKTVTALEEGTPLEISGATDAVESICYSIKCPAPTATTDTFSDQFGTHAVEKIKAALVCAPAVQGTFVTTTTLPCVPSAETCDGNDNDCDGLVDEDLGQTSCGVGGCARTVDNCVDGASQSCIPGSPSIEVCNGADDDCDGQVDEDLGMINCGVGACFNEVPSCLGGTPQNCVPGVPSVESCGNDIDDDCDGSVDEGC